MEKDEFSQEWLTTFASLLLREGIEFGMPQSKEEDGGLRNLAVMLYPLFEELIKDKR